MLEFSKEMSCKDAGLGNENIICTRSNIALKNILQAICYHAPSFYSKTLYEEC